MEEDEILCESKKELLGVQTSKKLENILCKLLEPDFKIKNDLYLNLLLTHWINKTGDGDQNQELNELFFQWVLAASNLWDGKKNKPPTPVLLFALHICCQLSKNELFFVRMNSENVFQQLTEICQANEEVGTSVTVEFIMLLSSVLEYAAGVEWLLTTTYWNDVLNIALRGQTSYIKKKAYQFIIKLLETTILVDQDFCEELVEILLEPLNEAAVQAERTKDSKDENKKNYESVKPSLDLISEVADTLLKNFNKTVLQFFLEMEIPEAIQNILNYSQIQDFSLDLLKIRFAFLFYQLCVKLEGIQQPTHDEESLTDIRIMFDLIRTEIEKDHVICVIKICHYAQVLYSHLDNRLPLCIRKGESIEFQNQMMLFLLVPIMAFSYQLIGRHKTKELLWTDDVRHDFYMKFAKISAIRTLEITSRWQERLPNNRDLIEDVTVSLQYIQKTKKIMDKDQAAFIFRPLIYSLRDLLWRLSDYEEIPMPLRGIRYINLITDMIIDLVESFDLTWKDSIEIISVLDLACETVQKEFVDYQVTVKFLKLLNLAILRCMSPNMVLLMGSETDTSISQVGGILYSKCQNRSHQIRQGGLEVIHTLALNAREKFPEFTNVLFNADLPQLVIKMALNDSEHEVRAIAIKCIQALIRVEDIWEVYQSNYKFWDKILNLLVNETRGTVRKEAARLIYKVYLHYNFPDDVLPRLYDVMTHAAIGDIHWEVKCNALSFWACTLKNHLRTQGMIDRGFPSHIFSKEKKKIITLTEAEKAKRVVKVLNQLSEIGCLYVLKTALKDEFDEEVSKSALAIARDMVKMFKAHKITCDNVDLMQPRSPTSSYGHSDSLSPLSSDTQSSPDRRFSLESSQSQYPDSPSSSDLGPASPEVLSSPDYTAPTSPNSQASQCKVRPIDLELPKECGQKIYMVVVVLGSNFNIITSQLKNGGYYYTYNSSYDGRKSQKLNDKTSIAADEELENFGILNTACTEADLLILENDIDIGVCSADNDDMENSMYSDMAETGKMFDELLKLNDDTLLEEICNPRYQVKSTATLKTKKCIPPSEYVRFCSAFVELNEKKTTQLTPNLDEFDSLLDDLLKEYGLNSAT